MRKIFDSMLIFDETVLYEIVVSDKPSRKGIDGGRITTAHVGMKGHDLCVYTNGTWVLTPENSDYPAFARRAIKILKEKYNA